MGAKGKLFVADLLRYGIGEVSGSGRSLGVLGARGRGPGRFQVPTGVAVDRAGRVFATDGVNADVQEFVPTRSAYRFQRSFGNWRTGRVTRRLVQPLAVAVAAGRVYVGDARYGIVAFTESGRYLASWSPGSQFVVKSVSSGPGGNLWATFASQSGNPGQQRTYRFSADLSTRTNVGFALPSGAPYLVIDGSGDYFSLSGTPGATVTRFRPQPGGSRSCRSS